MRIPLVLLADVLHNVVARQQAMRGVDGEGLGVGARVVDRDVLIQIPEAGARVALDGVKLLSMRVADEIEPELVVETNAIDNPGVALPFADGVSVPARIGIFGMLA